MNATPYDISTATDGLADYLDKRLTEMEARLRQALTERRVGSNEAETALLAALREWYAADVPLFHRSYGPLLLACQRLFSQPEPVPTTAAVDRCSKCGHDAIGMAYHRDEYACGYGYRQGQRHSIEQPGEHLHRHCQRCHYEWIERCVTP